MEGHYAEAKRILLIYNYFLQLRRTQFFIWSFKVILEEKIT